MRRLALVPILLLAAAPAAAQAPEHRLAPAGPELEESFSSVSGLRVLSNGTLVVSDAIEETLQRIDPRSGAVTALSRKGAGPGEYGQPDQLLPLPSDEAWLVDLGNARLTRVRANGQLGESHSMVTDTGSDIEILIPGGADARGNLYGQPSEREPRDSAEVVRFQAGGAAEATVATIGLPAVSRSTSGSQNNRQEVVLPRPYAARDAWAVASDGRIAVARTSPYRLDWVAVNGAVLRGPEVQWTPPKISQDDRDAWIDQLGSGVMMMVSDNNGQMSVSMRRGGGGRRPPMPVDQLEWPETMPAFPPGAVRVAPDGTAWVERYVGHGQAPRYDVFDAQGRRVRQVILPAASRVAGFGTGVVWLVRTDDDGLQWLRPYRMPA